MAASADPVSAILGIDARGSIQRMSAVQNGLPLASLDHAIHAIAPSDVTLASRIVARSTLARRRKASRTAPDRAEARLSADEGTRLARLASVWAMALEVWGGEASARRFMFENHPLLHGRRPVDVVLDSELGRPMVEGILGRLQYGSAV